MKNVLFGATGNVGRRIATEALNRGHEVIAVHRNPAQSQAPGTAQCCLVQPVSVLRNQVSGVRIPLGALTRCRVIPPKLGARLPLRATLFGTILVPSLWYRHSVPQSPCLHREPGASITCGAHRSAYRLPAGIWEPLS
jgi:hypothetical protein